MSTVNAPSSARYWCHHCGGQVPIYMAPDPTCQRCNEQFIEEMDGGGDDPQSFLDDTLGEEDNDNDDDDDIFQYFRRSLGSNNNSTSNQEATTTGEEESLETMLQNALSNLLASGNDDRNRSGNITSNARGEGRTPVYLYSGVMDGNVQLTPINPQQSSDAPTSDTARVYFQMRGDEDDEEDDDNDDNDGEGRRSNRSNNNLQGLLRAIATLTGVETIGNPNDYVFSQTALDNIITQLMEQTGGHTAPPPAPDDVIAALPKRPLSEKEFKEQIDCSVCKEDFVLEESVIELPCMHLYHDDCINPWLKVNGTCPVCRHPVEPSQDDDDNNNIDRNPTDTTTPQQSDTTTTTTTPTTTTNDMLQQPSRTPVPSAASAAFAWMTRSSPPPSSWPSSVAGSTFTWGPGVRYRSQPSESDDESVDLLIDLD